MTAKQSFLLCLSAALLLLPTPAWSQGQAVGELAAVNRDDALPPGAIARLGTLRFWHGDSIGALAHSPDGKFIASGSRFARDKPLPPGSYRCTMGRPDYDNAIWLWEADTGKAIRRFEVPYGPVRSLAF